MGGGKSRIDRLQKTSEKVFRQGINLNSPEPFSFEDICHKGFLLDAVRVGKVELRDGFWLSVWMGGGI